MAHPTASPLTPGPDPRTGSGKGPRFPFLPGMPRSALGAAGVPAVRAVGRTVGRTVGRLILGLALCLPGLLEAQHVEDPVLPRGAILFQVGGVFTHAPGAFGANGHQPFGEPFFTSVDPGTFPALEPVQNRLRDLTGRSDLFLRVGEIRGRFEVNEQVLPIRVGYGLMDRVSLGVTVPFVRRRTDAHLLLDAGGANVGASPGGDLTGAFQTQSRAALDTVRAQVGEACEQFGEESEACVDGRATEARVAGFLDLLDSVWEDATPFPLDGTEAGLALVDRWSSVREDLFTWGAEGPADLPLATVPLGDTFLRNQLVNPVWGSDGFPTATPEAFLLLGDVEAHLVVGLLHLPPEGRRPGVRSAVEGTVRLPTGQSDSLSLVTPLDPPRGYAGGGVRWVTDLLLAEGRGGVLLTLEWSTFLEGDVVLLATDPDRPWDPTGRRSLVSGAPGDRLTLGVTPRWSVTPGLFLGGGYEWAHGTEGRWSGGNGGPVSVAPSTTQHRGVLEFRMAGWSTPLVEDLRFPVELAARGVWAFAGESGTPRERRVELGARVLRRR